MKDPEGSSYPELLSPTSDLHVEDAQKECFSTGMDKVFDYYSAQSGDLLGDGEGALSLLI